MPAVATTCLTARLDCHLEAAAGWAEGRSAASGQACVTAREPVTAYNETSAS